VYVLTTDRLMNSQTDDRVNQYTIEKPVRNMLSYGAEGDNCAYNLEDN
jgi:hypothetical protein